MIRYIFFDLDGTITDPGIGITNSVMYALLKFGIKVEERSRLYPFIGPPLYESFMKEFGFTREDAEKAVVYYREYFADKGIFENIPYEGIENMLERIREMGIKTAIATSKPEEFADRILEHFDLTKYFDFCAGATMDSSRVKKSDVIRYAMERAGIADCEEVLMVGDRAQDVSGAKDNRISCVGVTYGYGSREELEKAGAKYIISSPDELIDIVKNKGI